MQENNTIESIVDSFLPDLMNFLNDIDLQLSIKQCFGVCPLEVAHAIVKDYVERKKED